MPPPVPSESDSESEYLSGSESVHTVHKTEEPSDSTSIFQFAPFAEPAPHLPAPRIPRPGSTGALANKAKRKAGLEDDNDDHVAKTRRTEFSDSASAESDEDEDDDEDDEDEDDDDDEDDEDIPTHGDYVNQPFSADAGPVSNGAVPKTALELLKQMHPHRRLPHTRPGNIMHCLSPLPVKQIPVVTAGFNDSKRQNMVSFLMQAVGDVLPADKACSKCTKMNGVYRGACVVVRDPRVLNVTCGACANCWYGRTGYNCSLRRPPHAAAVRALPAAPAAGTASVKATPIPVPQVPPPTHSRPPGPAPLHPGYAAALASGAVAAAPASAATSNGSPELATSLLRDQKASMWESLYRSMGTENLLRAHEGLVEQQDDLTTRLMALNRVVWERLRAREGDS
ncbi:hypothetical protein C8A00DRAFT_45241 [Chaetomidium leptoderma]|uniref:Uncharacterized protein n=1 Tax=Chaetomidium leptoderma TaxID=669021 RepID=A0AAN6VJY5_9PEZI|nr:hypothetical protein C8A00DRAFT_45241 [Chaetomidium leptoderma]